VSVRCEALRERDLLDALANRAPKNAVAFARPRFIAFEGPGHGSKADEPLRARVEIRRFIRKARRVNALGSACEIAIVACCDLHDHVDAGTRTARWTLRPAKRKFDIYGARIVHICRAAVTVRYSDKKS
jgi:hypothetical protein